MILAGGAPALVVCLVFLWRSSFTATERWTYAAALVGVWLGFALAARKTVIHPLRTLGNMIAGLREGDYSTRAREGNADDVLGGLYAEANALSRMLSEQRLRAMEATALLGQVMAEIDVAVFAFDGARTLKLVNRAGEALLAQPRDRLLGQTVEGLGLTELVESPQPVVVERSFPRGHGRWSVRSSTFWERGLPHRLLIVQDLTRTLREEQIQAWQRLVRVIGHELNNSLTPIKSIAESLRTLLRRQPPAPDWLGDADDGLAVIAGRADGLARFMDAYSRLAKLPPPRIGRVQVTDWVRRVVGLETRLAVAVQEGAPVTVSGDGDQLDQLLINVVRNAVDAALATGGGVALSWRCDRSGLSLWVDDEGPGLPNTTNLFVPFFTTKPGGSGIGLVLSRQIAEAHGGQLSLENRSDRTGCRAILRLPV
jgi:nitrogen fixation/metabolism regulation signal transduction histidine kinase